MPATEPNEWLNREDSVQNASPLIEASQPVLREVINFGTRIFEAAQGSTSKEGEKDLPLLISYLHILEMTDGIDVLLSQSCVTPAIPLLRSMFESNLGIAYMLEKDTDARSYDWLVAHYRARLAFYKSNSLDTEVGRQLRRDLKNDARLVLPKVPQVGLNAAIANLEKLLSKSSYKDAGQRFSTKRKEWYSASNGPTNVRGLAKHLRKLLDYEVLYRKWSTVVHAVDLTRFLTRTRSGTAAFYPLRAPKELTSVAFLAVALVLESTWAIVRHYEIACDLRDWYISEVGERWSGLQRMQVDFVERELNAD